MVDATLAALAELPDAARHDAHAAVRRPTRSRTSMNDASRPRGRRLRRPAPQRRGRDRRAGPPGDRPPLPATSSSTARGPARRTSPWLEPDVNDRIEELAEHGVAGGRRGADRLRLRPHGGHLRPRHRGERDRREARPGVRPGRDRRASTRASWPWSATCSLERAAAERGADAAPASRRRRSARRGTSARPAAAPTPAAPARRCAGRTEAGGPYDAPARPRAAGGRRGRRAGARAAAGGRRGRGHQVQPGRRRHRGRPGRRSG